MVFPVIGFVDLHHLYLFADVLLYRIQHRFFFRGAERYGLAFLYAAAECAHAVNVVLRFFGQVVIHTVIHVGYIYAARIHVCGDRVCARRLS